MNIIVAIFILGIIITIHELGHFLLAKKNGVTVIEFSIGMGPRIASFLYKGTRYSLKVFPIGGSCNMLGENEIVNDEGSLDKKGPWARFSVIFAGAFFNFIFAYILALILLGNIGVDKPYIEKTVSNSPSEGKLQKGDLITAINGSPIHFSRDINYYLYFNPLTAEPAKITYLRNGKKETTTVTPQLIESYQLGFDLYNKNEAAKLKTVKKDYPLDKAGLLKGDVIVNYNGTEITSWKDLATNLENHPLTGEEITITYLRDNSENKVTVVPKKITNYTLGMGYNSNSEQVSALEVIKYSIFEIRSNIVNTLKSVLFLFTGRANMRDMAGPIGIVNLVDQIVTQSKDYGLRVIVLSLIQFSIMISANLGVINLLPIPALDGGRLVFIIIEIITRKPVPKEKEAMIHMVGFVLLMMLMVYVVFNDFRNIFS